MAWFCLPRVFVRSSMKRSSQGSQEYAQRASLATLPIDVLELIAKSLDLQERMALASCCRALWERRDVQASTLLWSPVNLGKYDVLWDRRARSLAAWLAQHRGGVAALRLHLNEPWWKLQGLRIERPLGPPPDRDAAPLLRLLPNLAGGTLRLELRSLGLRALPAQLTALSRLQELSVRANGSLGLGGEASFRPLQQLTTLTLLDLRYCGLRVLPPQVSALPSLQDLDASTNPELGASGPAALAPLQQLASLTHLDLSECGLQGLPPMLSLLTNLADLAISSKEALVGREALEPLRTLGCLTRLDLSCCGAEPSAVRALVGPRVMLTCW